MSVAKPRTLGVRVKRFRKTPKGVLIETETTEQQAKLASLPELKKAGLAAVPPPLKKPQIIIYDVDGTADGTTVLADIITRTFWTPYLNTSFWPNALRCIRTISTTRLTGSVTGS